VALRNTNLEFYRARADEARAAGEEATLDHVRERCRRSEAAWTALADRAERTELMVLITPRLVRALDPDEVPPLPTVPGDFLQVPVPEDAPKATPPAASAAPIDAPQVARARRGN